MEIPVPVLKNTMKRQQLEIAAPVPVVRLEEDNAGDSTGKSTKLEQAWAILALALSILSLFVMPILFGAAGIVLGFIARRRGAKGLVLGQLVSVQYRLSSVSLSYRSFNNKLYRGKKKETR